MIYKYPKEKTTILVKFLPNYDYNSKNIGEYTQELVMGSKEQIRTSSLHFTKVLMEDSIKVLKFGKQIKNILNSFPKGCYLNSDGLFLTSKDSEKIYDEENHEYSLKEYYLDKDGDVILPSESINYNLNNLEHRTDVLYQEMFNPFEISSNLYFQFDIDWVHGFIRYHNFKLVKKEPLWREGEDKNSVLELYKGVPTLDECISKYKEDTIKEYPNVLFGEDAYKERGKAFDKKIIENMERDLRQKKENYNRNYNNNNIS